MKQKYPKFVYEPPPQHFKTTLDKVRYCETEKERWITGHQGLNGTHYYFLTQTFAKMGTSGIPARPIYRDTDEWLHDQINYDLSNENDTLWLSRREIGKSLQIGGLHSYFARVHAGCSQVMTSADKERIFTVFNEKVLPAIKSIYKPLAPISMRGNKTKNSIYLNMIFSIKNPYDEDETMEVESQITGIETNETPASPKNISSKRVKFCSIDEVALHNRVDEVLGSLEPALMDGPIKGGYALLTGTVEDKIKEESLRRLREINNKEKNPRLSLYFTPYWHGMFIDQFGNSDEKKAREWREKRLEEKKNDPIGLAAFIKNYPETIEDALSIGLEGNLPKECMVRLAEQSKIILRNNIAETRYNLLETSNGIVAQQDNSGPYVILDHPKAEHEYIAGKDPIPYGTTDFKEEAKAELNKRSLDATIIKDRDENTYPAFLMERDMDSHIMVSKSIMLQRYFNDAKAMIERNRGGATIEKYKDLGMLHLLAREPKMFRGKGAWKNPPFGVAKGGAGAANNTVDKMINDRLIRYILDHWEKINLTTLLTQMTQYLDKNTDLLDAFLMCEIYDYDLGRAAKKRMEVPKYREIKYIANENGKNVWKTMRIPINTPEDDK